ncbi:MAG: hypothetical protein WDN03_05690 [Rhizomicrobium sp.]
MPVEIPRADLQPALRLSRHDRAAAGLAVPDRADGDRAARRPAADLAADQQWIAYSQHGAEFSNADLITVGIYYVVFVVVDLLAATFGFLMERGENWSLLWWLPLQRFGYRQLMYYVVVRSISAAIRGAFVGWGKLERTGTVQAHR